MEDDPLPLLELRAGRDGREVAIEAQPTRAFDPHQRDRAPVIAALLLTTLVMTGGLSNAQEAAKTDTAAVAPRAVEEIIVTAQKKEQSLEEVPISITAIDGEFLKKAGIDDLHKLAEYAPNVRFTTNPCCTTVFIRGFGNPFAASAFDPAVGLALDELSIPKEIYMSDPFYDVQRFEVLRGPQGTLFGKNTPAGLFNVVNARPTRELTGYVLGRAGTLDVHRVEAAVSGSPSWLRDFAQLRVSGVELHGPGDVENTKLGIKEPAAKQRAGRLEIALQPLRDLDVLLIGSGAHTTSRVFHVQLARLTPAELDFLRQFDPRIESDPFNHQNSIDLRDDLSRTTYLGQANFRYDLEHLVPVKNAELVTILGYTGFFQDNPLDVDFSPADILALRSPSPFDYHQLSAEMRASGTFAGPFRFGDVEALLGVLLFDANLVSDSHARSGKDFAKFLVSEPGFELVTGGAPPPGGVSVDEVLQRLGLNPLPDTGLLQNDGANFFLDQDTRSYALFGNAAWRFDERWTLSVGGRFTLEEKHAHLRNECLSPGVICAALGIDRFDLHESRSETDFSPKVTLQFFPFEGLSLFGTRAQGFKSGGFNNFTFKRSSIEVEPERAVSYEAGVKGMLLGNSLAYGLTLFDMEVDDLQLQNLTGGFVQVRNAASARARGIELDFRWLTPWEPLSVRGGGALTDARFRNFKNAPAMAGSGQTEQDLSGKRMPFVPKTQLIVTPELRVPFHTPALAQTADWLPPHMAVTIALDVLYRSSMYLDSDLDPKTLQDEYVKLNGRIFVVPADEKWSLGFAVDNLSNVDALEFATDSLVFPHAFSTFQEFQRRYTVEVRYNW
jgi:iron complex outermembrane recepter protein